MAADKITENVLTAMETIAQSVVDKVAYNKTVTCTIVDDSNREKGEYKVSDGSSKFSAYSDVTTYRNDTVVYVNILNGDYTEQKIIIGKKTELDTEPFVYSTPFSNFLACTPNLIPSDYSSNQYILSANTAATFSIHFLNLDIKSSRFGSSETFSSDITYSFDSEENLKMNFLSKVNTYIDEIGIIDWDDETIYKIGKQLTDATFDDVVYLENELCNCLKKGSGTIKFAMGIDFSDNVYQGVQYAIGSDDKNFGKSITLIISFDIEIVKYVPSTVTIYNFDNLNKYYKGFDQLGLKADFSSFLRDYNVLSGNYGIEIEVKHLEEKDDDKVNEYELCCDNGFDENKFYYTRTKGEDNEYNYTHKEVTQEDYKPNTYYYANVAKDTNLEMTSERKYYQKTDNGLEKVDVESSFEYEPNKFYYFIDEEEPYILSVDNGYRATIEYYVLDESIADVNYDNYLSFEDNELFYYNNAGERVSALPQTEKLTWGSTGLIEEKDTEQTKTENTLTVYQKKFSKINLAQNEYEPNQYYYYLDDSGQYQLDDANGFDGGKIYYEQYYKPVQIANFEANITYYYFDKRILSDSEKENGIVPFQKYYICTSENKFELQLGLTEFKKGTTYYIDDWEQVKTNLPTANCQYYVLDYKEVNLAQNEYEPNQYYYYLDDSGQYQLDDANGFDGGRSYYQLDWGGITVTKGVSFDKTQVYYRKTADEQYEQIKYNGFDKNKTYYYTNSKDNYTKVSLSQETYSPGLYYVKKIADTQAKTSIMRLDVSDMIGQPYGFSTPSPQEAVFDIKNLGDILSMEIRFFEEGNFYNKEGCLSTVARALMTSNIELYFGYGLSNIEGDEYLQLFTYDGLTYSASANPLDNMKKVYLKWAHKIDDQMYVLDKDNIDVLTQSAIESVINGEDTSYTMKLDSSISPVDERQYYQRTIEECDSDSSSDKEGQKTKYVNASYYKNGSADYVEGREYYKKGYFRTAEINANFSDYIVIDKETLYKRSSTPVTLPEDYDDDAEYGKLVLSSSKSINDTTGEVIEKTTTSLVISNLVNASTEGTFQKIIYTKSANGDYQRAWKRMYVDENSSIYSYYYLDYTEVDKEDASNILRFSPIEQIDNYKPNKWYYISIEDENLFDIRWYKYKLGAPSADVYSGVYWEAIPKGNDDNTYTTRVIDDFTLELHPDSVYNAEEKIKVVALYDNQPFYSNILEFTNTSAVINVPNQEQETALKASFQDGTQGNYFIYDESNSAIDGSQTAANRSIKLLFDLSGKAAASALKDADWVKWIFPIENTMIKVSTSLTSGTYSEERGWGVIYDDVKRENYELFYSLENYYGFNKNNNTITCNIMKDGVLYSTTAEFTFGQAGSNGSEYTLVLDLQNSDQVITLQAINNSSNSEKKTTFYYWGFKPVETKEGEDGVTYYQHVQSNSFNKIQLSQYDWGISTLYKDESTEYPFITVDAKYIGQTLYKEVIENEEKTYEQVTIDDWDKETTLYIQIANKDEPYLKVIEVNKNNKNEDEYYYYLGEVLDTYEPVILTNYTGNFKDLYEEGYIEYTDDSVVDSNTTFYYLNDQEEYIQLSSLLPQDSNLVVATLYDSNNQKVNFSAGEISWSWLYDQNLLTVEKYDDTSAVLNVQSKCTTQMNELCILQATLSGFGNYNLTSYLPIPVRETYEPVYFQGPTQIIYSSTGTPNYYKDEINLYYNDAEGEAQPFPITEKSFTIIHPNDTGDNASSYYPSLIYKTDEEGVTSCTIQPMSTYISGLSAFGIQCKYNDKIKWTQPILYIQNRYFSSTINSWDGSLSVDNDKNTILAKMIGAGSKNAQNQFSGVIMGDWTGNVNKNDSKESMAYKTGLYGFHEGETSFGFMEDGTGFIGKADKGRILFDGSESTITSANWTDNRTGMYMDIDDGFLLLQNDEGQYIKLNSLATGATVNGYSLDPSAIPLAGPGLDSSYPFVVRGDVKDFTAIGWQGDLFLHGTGNGGKGSITLNASAKTFPININDRFGIYWDGSFISSSSDIKGYAQKFGKDTQWCVSVKGTQTDFSFTTVDSAFSGLYANSTGDLYLSSELVIGQNFSANKKGNLWANKALLSNCMANSFTVKKIQNNSLETYSTLAEYLNACYGDTNTPTIGTIGWTSGATVSGGTITDTDNIGITSASGYGIKLYSSTNMSFSAYGKGNTLAGTNGDFYFSGRKFEIMTDTSECINLLMKSVTGKDNKSHIPGIQMECPAGKKPKITITTQDFLLEDSSSGKEVLSLVSSGRSDSQTAYVKLQYPTISDKVTELLLQEGAIELNNKDGTIEKSSLILNDIVKIKSGTRLSIEGYCQKEASQGHLTYTQSSKGVYTTELYSSQKTVVSAGGDSALTLIQKTTWNNSNANLVAENIDLQVTNLPVQINMNSAGITITGAENGNKTLKIKGIEPANQTGIYARFA